MLKKFEYPAADVWKQDTIIIQPFSKKTVFLYESPVVLNLYFLTETQCSHNTELFKHLSTFKCEYLRYVYTSLM